MHRTNYVTTMLSLFVKINPGFIKAWARTRPVGEDTPRGLSGSRDLK